MIPALFVDDKKKQYEWLYPHIVSRLEALGCDVRFEYAPSTERAISLLTSASHFQLVITDLLFPPPGGSQAETKGEDDPVGLEVIEAARRARKDSVIFAITRATDQRYWELMNEARRRGADVVRSRSEVRVQGGLERVAEELHGLLIDRKFVTDPLTITAVPARDPGVGSVIEELERPVLRSLIRQALRLKAADKRRIGLTYIRPGFSGAHVLATRMERDGEPFPAWHVIKFDRSRSALQRELRNAAQIEGRYRPGLFITPAGSPVEPSHKGEWYALAFELFGEAVTLRQWLARQRPSATDVGAVLGLLFLGNGLRAGYRHMPDREESPAGHALRVTSHRQVRIEQAFDELRDAASSVAGGAEMAHDRKVTELRRFIHDGDLLGMSLDRTPLSSFECYCHGDLHGSNVLVASVVTPAIAVIDLAQLGVRHWASDYTRLLSDILLRVIDGGAEAAFWTHMPFWRQVAIATGELCPMPTPPEGTVGLPPDPGTAPGLAALDWMVGNIRAVFSDLDAEALERRRWEFQVALAVELLRGTFQLDVPVPKRVMCELAAHDLLVSARELLG